MKPVTASRKNGLRRLAREREGTVAIIAAFTLVTLVMLTGGVVDFGAATMTRSQLHGAEDAAAVAAVVAPNAPRPEDRETVARRYFNANYTGGMAGQVHPVISEDFDSYTVRSADATIPSHFLKVAHINDISVASTTVVSKASTTAMPPDMDLMLIIDSSASMNCKPEERLTLQPDENTRCDYHRRNWGDTRLYAVEEKLLEFLMKLKPETNADGAAAINNEYIRVGLLEWDTDVRGGRKPIKNYGPISETGPADNRLINSMTKDGQIFQEKKLLGHRRYAGHVKDVFRNDLPDPNVSSVEAMEDNHLRADGYSCGQCGFVDTYNFFYDEANIGGEQVRHEDGGDPRPDSEGGAQIRSMHKVAIFLTDGALDRSEKAGRLSGTGIDPDLPPHEGALAACQRLKTGNSARTEEAERDSGVIVYTIGFGKDIVNDDPAMDPTRDFLRQCASEPVEDHAFTAETADDLAAVMGKIAGGATKVRITQ